MQLIRYIFITLVSIVFTAILFAGIYLFLGKLSGNIVLCLGLFGLFIIFIFALIGLITGQTTFFKWKGRLKLYFTLSYIVVTGILLIVIWMFNFVINDELGELTAADKLNFILRKSDVNDEVVSEPTKDYPVFEHQHITFKYTPDAEENLHGVIRSMNEIVQVESEVFGGEMPKTENLEVIVLPSFTEYLQAKPLSSEIEGGSYSRTNNKALIYQQQEGFHDDGYFLTDIFSHEYGHYLMDLFLTENGINFEDVPAWYHEGVSEYIRMRVTGDLRIPGNVDPKLKLSNLQTFGDWDAAKRHSDVYFLAEKAVEYLVGSHSDTGILTDILLHQKETGSFKESFEQLTGLKLATLHTQMYSLEEDLSKAYDAWQESDFETAEKLYKEIILQHPREFLAWHQYSMMLEEQKKWDEALSARRKVNNIDPQNAAGFLETSYLLTIIDTKEAVETAQIALELKKKKSNENSDFYQDWLNEISQYYNLINEKKYTEAYQVISQSEQLANYPTIMEDLKNKRE